MTHKSFYQHKILLSRIFVEEKEIHEYLQLCTCFKRIIDASTIAKEATFASREASFIFDQLLIHLPRYASTNQKSSLCSMCVVEPG